MDYKSLYLCADDSEEMPGFGDIRNTEFSYNQPYAAGLQSEDETKGAKLEPEVQQKFCKSEEMDDDKPFLYNDRMPKMENDLKYAFNDAPPPPDDCLKDGPSSGSKINGLANFVATKFPFEQSHSTAGENRVSEFDSSKFPFCLGGGVSSDERKLSGEDPELYDDETEEEEEEEDDAKDLKTENQGNTSDAANRDDLDRNFDSASDENDEDDDETDVEKQTWNPEITDDQLQNDEEEEEEDCQKDERVQGHEENDPENPENRENASERGSGDVVKKKKKSRSRKQGEGDQKGRKKRKRRRKEGEEPSEKKARLDASRKNLFERKNIRKIFEEENLDEETKAAQKEEMERKQRLSEIQEKLKQQALELRAQREKDMAANLHVDSTHKRVDLATSSLKSLLEDKSDSSDSNSVLDPNKTPPLVAEKPVVTDVVEISSSENEDNNEDEDDDLIVMSDAEEEPEEEGGEDTESSGSHVNDAMNRPDVNGCVLVNVGHPSDEPDIFLAPQLASAVKPHQIGGIRFMYDNVVESLERYKTNNGFGCILAHSMGLGKTIQVVSFVDIFLRHTGAKSVLIIVPVNTLQNWVNEFNMWMPVVDEESQMGGGIDKEIFWPREFKLYVINDNMKTTNSRTKIVADWHETGGVLLLGYEMYRLLIKSKGLPVKSRRSTKKSSATSEPVVIDVEEEEFNKEIVKNLQEALVRPGPDLVVCDEGHRIKNSHASISQVLKNIRTRRRIVLTGYPLQNNLLEYWCMVDFVRPNYLGSKQEFCNMFERPIMNGQCADSTPKDVKLMRFRAHVLHSLLEGFVQRRGHTVLQSALPQKEEYVIFVRLSPIQRKLYNEFMSAIKDSGNIASWSNSNNPIKAFSVCCKIWNHPDILYQVVEQRKDDNDLDLEEAKAANGDVMQSAGVAGAPAPTPKRTYRRNAKAIAASINSINSNSQASMSSVASNGSIVDGEGKNGEEGSDVNKEGGAGLVPATNEKKESQVISYEWAVDLMKDYLAGMAEHSGKMVILMDIIDESVKVGDKILVFSQSLYTLTLIEEYLSRRCPPGMDEYWQKNRNYYRLDGGTAGIDREKLINQFNDYNNSKVHLFLLSTRAGCLGINLIGACRVVIFDASWNPCHDCQAVCRVYRYGQNKCCYVYRLVSDNTMEKNIYDRQINKQGISDRVVDELNPQNLLSKKQVDVLMRNEDSEPSEITMEGYEERCGDSLLVNVVKKNSKWLTKEPFTHESLLLDRKDQKLTRHEKRLAKQGYEMEKKMSTMGFSRQSALYPKTIDGVTMVRFGQRPVASVRPMMSAPIKGGPNPRIISNQFRAPGLKPGVSVQQIQTTTDIIIPGTNTISDSTNSKIPAGEKVLVIKTPKGVYIRTSHGKIFAVRTAPKPGATPGGSNAVTGASTSMVSVASTSGAAVLTMTPARKGVIPSTGIQAEDAMEVEDDDDIVEETDAEGKSTSRNVSLTTATTLTTASAATVTSTSTVNNNNNLKDQSINNNNKDKVISAPIQRGTSLLRHQDQSSNSQKQQTTLKNLQPSLQQHPSTAQTLSASTAISASSSNLAPSAGGKPSEKEFPSSNPASTASVSAKAVGAPPPVKTVLPMQNNSKNLKKTKDKSESSFPSSGNLGGSKETGSIAPVNPQPIPKPVAQPQPVTNTAAQQMQQQNSFFDWNRKPLKDFEAPSLFGLQTSSSGHLGSLEGGMGDLLPGYLKNNNSSGLPPPPFFTRPSASSSSSSLLFGMTSPVSSAPSMGKAFPLNSPSPGQQDRSTSSSNKGLSAMMGSFSSPSSSSSLHHPVPMTPPSYLPHGINPYGIANPYSWMPNPMWMGASPMDVAHHPPHFPHDPSAYGNPSAVPEDFGSGSVNQGSNDLLGLDGFGGFPASFDDRSFSSLLMGDEDGSGNSGQGGGRRSGNRGAVPSPAYRQNPMAYPHPSAMGGYPYHNPYSPYGMPPHQPTGYYGPGANHPSSGGNMMARGGYISPSMHYPQHPGGFIQSPYDFTGGSRGLIQGSSSSSTSSKKGNFDVMKGD